MLNFCFDVNKMIPAVCRHFMLLQSFMRNLLCPRLLTNPVGVLVLRSALTLGHFIGYLRVFLHRKLNSHFHVEKKIDAVQRHIMLLQSSIGNLW